MVGLSGKFVEYDFWRVKDLIVTREDHIIFNYAWKIPWRAWKSRNAELQTGVLRFSQTTNERAKNVFLADEGNAHRCSAGPLWCQLTSKSKTFCSFWRSARKKCRPNVKWIASTKFLCCVRVRESNRTSPVLGQVHLLYLLLYDIDTQAGLTKTPVDVPTWYEYHNPIYQINF